MRHRLLSGWFGAGLCSYSLLFLALGTFSLVGFVDATAVRAAEEKPAEPAAEGEAEQLPEFGDDEAAAPAAAPAEPEAADTGAAAQDKTYLVWMWEALGLFYSVVFLALSFTLVALLVMNLLTARRDSILPTGLVEGFEAQLNEKKYQDAYEMAKNDDSFLGQVLSAGLAKLSSGYQPAIEAMQEVGEEENMKLEHRLSYMALIGTISPMVGLLGTVQGMISSFSVIANSPTTPKPSELAAGISTALFTTLVGLFIAIPAIALYNILRNRVARLVLEVGIVSEGLMGRFSGVGTKKS
ncbi:MAG TPA: MotA/TolQ/ExbB proton channel family protein [Thermoguttaceae bacterium]|nr:MotA/TolQ/ExbB proton channel family protein [Thermoguttaceae bacterium]